MLIPSGPMTVDNLANLIVSFVSAVVKDGVAVNGNRWNCRLRCLLDLSPVRRIGGGVNRRANLLAITLGSR